VIIALKQRQVDEFFANIPDKLTSAKIFLDPMRYAGTIVRAAQKAKWFETDPGDIDELTPSAVVALALEVSKAYNDALAVRPN
jgi:hypothetical protein